MFTMCTAEWGDLLKRAEFTSVVLLALALIKKENAVSVNQPYPPFRADRPSVGIKTVSIPAVKQSHLSHDCQLFFFQF